MKFKIILGQISAINELAITSNNIDGLASIFEDYLDQMSILPSGVEKANLVLSIVSERQISRINKRFRHISKPTDVLSFPLWENSSWCEAREMWSDLPLGDIFICPMQVAKFAQENKVTELCETVLDLCHGFLHLLGHDHIEGEQQKAMWQEQDKLLTRYFEKNEE